MNWSDLNLIKNRIAITINLCENNFSWTNIRNEILKSASRESHSFYLWSPLWAPKFQRSDFWIWTERALLVIGYGGCWVQGRSEVEFVKTSVNLVCFGFGFPCLIPFTGKWMVGYQFVTVSPLTVPSLCPWLPYSTKLTVMDS